MAENIPGIQKVPVSFSSVFQFKGTGVESDMKHKPRLWGAAVSQRKQY